MKKVVSVFQLLMDIWEDAKAHNVGNYTFDIFRRDTNDPFTFLTEAPEHPLHQIRNEKKQVRLFRTNNRASYCWQTVWGADTTLELPYIAELEWLRKKDTTLTQAFTDVDWDAMEQALLRIVICWYMTMQDTSGKSVLTERLQALGTERIMNRLEHENRIEEVEDSVAGLEELVKSEFVKLRATKELAAKHKTSFFNHYIPCARSENEIIDELMKRQQRAASGSMGWGISFYGKAICYLPFLLLFILLEKEEYGAWSTRTEVTRLISRCASFCEISEDLGTQLVTGPFTYGCVEVYQYHSVTDSEYVQEDERLVERIINQSVAWILGQTEDLTETLDVSRFVADNVQHISHIRVLCNAPTLSWDQEDEQGE